MPSLDLLEFVAALKAWREGVAAGTATLPERVAGAMVMTSDDAQCMTLHPSVDEVEFDVGPDNQMRGLLDTWPDAEGEPTLTATIEERTQLHVLNPHIARLLAWLYRSPSTERFSERPVSAPAALVSLIDATPLDFLPAPDGVPVLEERTPAQEVTEQLWLGEDTATVVREAPRAHEKPKTNKSVARKKRQRVSKNLVVIAVLLALISGAAAVWLVQKTL